MRCHKREIMVQGREEAGLITTMKSSFNIREMPTMVTVKSNSRRSRGTLSLVSSTVIPMGRQGSKNIWSHWTKEDPSAKHCPCIRPRAALGKSHTWSGTWLQTLMQMLAVKTGKDYLKKAHLGVLIKAKTKVRKQFRPIYFRTSHGSFQKQHYFFKPVA